MTCHITSVKTISACHAGVFSRRNASRSRKRFFCVVVKNSSLATVGHIAGNFQVLCFSALCQLAQSAVNVTQM
jgi:hypothetical protein